LCLNVLSLKIQTHRPNINDECKLLHCTFPYTHQKWHKVLLLHQRKRNNKGWKVKYNRANVCVLFDFVFRVIWCCYWLS
jgi:hypothetical protein